MNSPSPLKGRSFAPLLLLLIIPAQGCSPGLPAAVSPAVLAAPLLLLLLLLIPAQGCSPGLRGALVACAAAAVSPAVLAAADLALHQGEGWERALAELALSEGECALKAAVRAVADRPVGTAPLALLPPVPGAPVSDAEAQARAVQWLRGRL